MNRGEITNLDMPKIQKKSAQMLGEKTNTIVLFFDHLSKFLILNALRSSQD